MNTSLSQVLVGIFSGFLVAYLAYRARALSLSGFWAAAIVGSITFGLGGIAWAILLLSFFIFSSLLSIAFKQKKKSLSEKFSKGSRRDWAQVLANGGVPTLLALSWFILREVNVDLADYGWVWLAYAGSLAAASADTWATELGVLNSRRPLLITSLKPVDPGTSGGISLTGAISACVGSLFIAILAVIMSWAGWVESMPQAINWGQLGVITLAGLLGSLADSLLGATLQAIYFCQFCEKETEKHPLHTCGSITHLARGLTWLNNDWVNVTCVVVGAVVAGLLSFA